MKKNLCLLATLTIWAALPVSVFSQGIGIGTTTFTPVGSAMLEMRSTAKGFLMPRMTEVQRDAIVAPATGLLIYQTDNSTGFYYYDGGAWQPLGGADNLGNHRATQNVRMNNHWLSGDGDNEGLFVNFSGNVGVGTGSPTKLLQVETSNNGLNVPLYLRNTNNAQAGGNAVGLAFVNEVAGTFYKGAIVHERLGNFGIGSMHFLNNGNGAAGSDATLADARMTIQSNGNVGINKTTPSDLLDVAGGNVRVSSSGGTAYGLVLQNPAGTFSTTHKAGAQGANITYTWPTTAPALNQVLQSDASGNLSWTNASSGWGLTGNAATNPAVNYLGTTDGQPMRIATNATERMRINSGAAEVGIGMTAAANNSLDITNTTTTGRGVNVTANSLTSGTAISSAANSLTSGSGLSVSSSATGFTSTNGLANFSLSGNNAANTGTVLKAVNSGTNNTGTTLMVTNAANGLSMRVNDDGTDTDATPFVVSANGNTGIGTASPNKKLHVVSDQTGVNVVTLQNTQNNGWTSFDLLNQAGTLSATWGFGNSGVGAFFGNRAYLNSYSNDFVMTRNATNYDLFMQGSSGNIGINTNSPVQKLTVTDGNIRLNRTGGTAGEIQWQGTGTGVTTIKAGAQGATNLNYTWPTVAPTAGQALISDASGNLSWGSASAGWGLTGNAATNPAVNYLGTTDGQPMRIATNATERMRINSGAAEVGIGMTAAANNSLDITNTTTTGRGVNVTANSLTSGSAISTTTNALTSGSGLSVSSSATGFTSTNGLGNFTLSGNNAANTGTVLKAVNSGTNNTGTTLMVTNAANGLSMRVNDDGTDTDATPFVVSANGNTGIGLAGPNHKLHVRGGDNSSSVGAATTNVLQYLENTNNDGSVVMNMQARTAANVFSSRMGINPTYNSSGIGPSVYAWYVTMNTDQRQIFMYDYPNRHLHIAPDVATINNVGIGLNQPTVGSKLTLNGGFAVGTGSGAYSTTAAPAGGAIIQNNVGIGNTNPTQKLLVTDGNIRLDRTGGTAGEMQWQGTGAGVTTIRAGAQGGTNINYIWPTTAPAANGAVLTSTTGGQMSWDAFLTPTTVQSAANATINPANYTAGAVAGMSIANVPAGTYLVSFNANMTRNGSTACSCVVRAGGTDQMDTERNFEIPAAVSEFTLQGRFTLGATGTVEIRCMKTSGGAGFIVGKRAMTLQRSN